MAKSDNVTQVTMLQCCKVKYYKAMVLLGNGAAE